ncbi:kinesin-like protein Klp5 [Tulasnella sp. 403]|nr:kinesin-like protein Klp5 [Tulasnella sp. 403]
MSQAASITVAVRVRPPTGWEQDRLPEPVSWNDSMFMGDGALSSPRKSAIGKNLRPIIQVVDDRVLIFDPKDLDVSRSFEQRGFLPPGSKRYKDQRFTFDRVFDETAQQVDVFEQTTKPLLDGLLDGFNATVFAYGATGCGKTHTISGTESDPGIIYLTMTELFAKIEERKDDMLVEVSLSFLEIYNEEIRDLLVNSQGAPRGGLQMREDKSNRIIVASLSELHPKNADEVKMLVLEGNTRRTQSPTHANQTSSRSHAVLQINVAQTPRTASTTEERTMATLSIIDLAGSERASATRNMGDRMVEGANINKSLLALGNCINALCESGNRTRHVPYRNSKLTRLLKFSLGGNCKTVMIVCVAPTSAHFEDTQNTLKYANRAKEIKTKVSRNFINVDRHVGQYVEAINRLNCEVAELKAKLAAKIGGETEVAKRRRAEGKAEMDRVRADIQVKVDSTRPTLMDSGTCEGNLGAAQKRLEVTKIRLLELDAQASTCALPSDLQAERALLQSLVAADEATVRPGSSTHQRMTKAANANALLEAMLRAVSERKYDRMDEIMIETIKTDVRLKRLEADQSKLQAKESVLRDTVGQQASMIASLVGILARCTVMMREGGEALQRVSHDMSMNSGIQESVQLIQAVAASLTKISQSNDQTFQNLVGQSTSSYTGGYGGSLFNFTGHSAPARRSSLPLKPPVVKVRRRSSAVAPVSASPGRRPRRPSVIRTSLAQGQVAKPAEKKSLRWRDEAGEGDLDDAGLGGRKTQREAASGVTGSETEWEDEMDKTDESFNSSNASKDSSSSSVTVVPKATTMVTAVPPRKARTSRLDPGFLKSRVPALGMVAEVDDETPSLSAEGSQPLGELSNQPLDTISTPTKNRRNLSATPTKSGSARQIVGSTRKSRISNLGPVRVEKGRRRSSMIPQLSPQAANGARRSGSNSSIGRRNVSDSDISLRKSPMKKVRRISAMGGVRNSLPAPPPVGLLAKRPWRPSLSTRLAPIVSNPKDAPTKRIWRPASLVLSPPQANTLAAELSRASVPVATDPCRGCANPCDDNGEGGFHHEEWPTRYFDVDQLSDMLGRVRPYFRMTVISTGKNDWEKEVTEAKNTLAYHLSDTSSRKSVAPRTKETDPPVTGVYSSEASDFLYVLNGSHQTTAYDDSKDTVLVFPDYKMVTNVDVSSEGSENLWETVLDPALGCAGVAPSQGSQADRPSRSWVLPYHAVVLICSHKRRDKRCAIAAPVLKRAITSALESRGWEVHEQLEDPELLQDSAIEEISGTPDERDEAVMNRRKALYAEPANQKKALILYISHIGGHKYAGNVIIHLPQGAGVCFSTSRRASFNSFTAVSLYSPTPTATPAGVTQNSISCDVTSRRDTLTTDDFDNTPETEHDDQTREFLVTPSQEEVDNDTAKNDERVEKVETRMWWDFNQEEQVDDQRNMGQDFEPKWIILL